MLQSEISETVIMNYCIYLHTLFSEYFPSFPESPSILNKLQSSSSFCRIFPPEGLLAGNSREIFSLVRDIFIKSIIGPVFQEEKLLGLNHTSICFLPRAWKF